MVSKVAEQRNARTAAFLRSKARLLASSSRLPDDHPLAVERMEQALRARARVPLNKFIRKAKYSTLLRDEAIKLALKVGRTEASRSMGIPMWTIANWLRVYRRQRPDQFPRDEKKVSGQKYNPKDVAEAIGLAIQFHQQGRGTFETCLKQTCKAKHLNFSSIMRRINEGIAPLPQGVTLAMVGKDPLPITARGTAARPT